MEMEMEKVEPIRVGVRKRDRPETATVDERQAREDKFWDELIKVFGARPIRRDSEHLEEKTSWIKLDLEAERRASAAACLSEAGDDDPGNDLKRFRDRWNSQWSGANRNGDFEDATLIPPMRYTDEPPCCALYQCDTLQVFSVKIAGIGEGLRWPLDVFGIVAVRDTIDQNRNIIFQRSSLNCQTLTEKDSNLVLTGPTRAVVLSGSIFIEVDLKVKGTSEDKTLFSDFVRVTSSGLFYSRLLQRTRYSKFSTLEFTLGHIIYSQEATLSIRVTDGSWPDGFHGEFAACTTSVDGEGGTKSVDGKEIILLGFGPEKGLVTGDGKIELSRRVVCVQCNSKLEVAVKAWQGDNIIVVNRASFTVKESGRSYGKLEIASCKMEVTVAWSFISSTPERRKDTILENNRCCCSS